MSLWRRSLRKEKLMFCIKIYILIDQQVLIKFQRNCFFLACIEFSSISKCHRRAEKNVNTKYNTLSFESEHDTGKSNILNTSGTNSRHVISLNSTWRVFMLRRRVIGRAEQKLYFLLLGTRPNFADFFHYLCILN